MRKCHVISFAMLAVVFISNAADANEWSLYGSARMATFFVSEDQGELTSDVAGRDQINNTLWELQGNSRIGATITGDHIDARFEVGVNETNVSSRLLYGIWKFSENWSLKIGKDFTPIQHDAQNRHPESTADLPGNVHQAGTDGGLFRRQTFECQVHDGRKNKSDTQSPYDQHQVGRCRGGSA